MEERKTVKFKKDEFAIKEYIKKFVGKGKLSKVKIEYTPIGEKVIISTHKPGVLIGKGGGKIAELTDILKKQFKLENPHIEIDEITEPEFDAQIISDEIALSLERFGPLKFKISAYKSLGKIMKAGALGAEIILSGKLPGARAKKWKFAKGYMIKTGDSAKVVDRAQARAETKPGTIGIKTAILSPYALLKDKININEELINNLKARTKDLESEKNEQKTNKNNKFLTNSSFSKGNYFGVQKENQIKKNEI